MIAYFNENTESEKGEMSIYLDDMRRFFVKPNFVAGRDCG